MKSFSLVVLSFAFTGILFFTGCKKEDVPVIPPTCSMTITFDHIAGTQQFYFDSSYVNANGDIFSANLFKYYVSNIVLIKSDNTEYFIPESYFLVNHANPATRFIYLNSLPGGMYKGIKFILGVDSMRSVSGIQAGALDPLNGMFWDWNTGYIFFKLEGTSPAIPTPANDFTYHVGGFAIPNRNFKIISLNFNSDELILTPEKVPGLYLNTDVLELFQNPATIDMATFPNSVTTIGSEATTLSNNYTDLFSYDHLKNN